MLVRGFKFNFALIGSATSAGAISLALEVIFKKFIWIKCPHLFYPWLCSIPYIGGKWEGTLQSDYRDPKTGKKVEPINAKMQVAHEFDRLTVTLDTNKTHSSSYISDVWHNSGRKYLCYTYFTDADNNRETNPNHDGTAKLRIIRDDITGELLLEGHYFTGRKTTGKMTFKRSNKKTNLV